MPTYMVNVSGASEVTAAPDLWEAVEAESMQEVVEQISAENPEYDMVVKVWPLRNEPYRVFRVKTETRRVVERVEASGWAVENTDGPNPEITGDYEIEEDEDE